ncbi:unnamed protein product [Caretta caretta]
MLDRLAKGEGSSSMGSTYGLNESTMHTVKRHEAKIRASVAASAPKSAKVSFYTHDSTIQKMEKALNIGIEDQTQNRVPLEGPVIREKSKRLCDHLKQDAASTSGESSVAKESTFIASKRWFEKFKRRTGWHHLPLAYCYPHYIARLDTLQWKICG